ncbi:MAG: hypothetical protein ACRC7C_08965 [Beijerinckiaceae bacterium]
MARIFAGVLADGAKTAGGAEAGSGCCAEAVGIAVANTSKPRAATMPLLQLAARKRATGVSLRLTERMDGSPSNLLRDPFPQNRVWLFTGGQPCQARSDAGSYRALGWGSGIFATAAFLLNSVIRVSEFRQTTTRIRREPVA